VGRGVGQVGGSFLAGAQSGDRGQHRVEVLPSAEVPGQGPPGLRVADAVLDADPLRRRNGAGLPVVGTQLCLHQLRRARRTDLDGLGALPYAVDQFRVTCWHARAEM
jgi:hypothetical protein